MTSGVTILWGQILVVSLIVLATIWGATQWTAWRLGFQPQLGAPWFEVVGAPVYLPPALFWWWYQYDAYAPTIFIEGGMIEASGGFAAIGIAIGLSVLWAREANDATTYGSARWARKTEVRAAGLLDPDGVVLGRFENQYLRHNGPEHVLCFAPTRSGKGVGLVIPTLLTWPGSAIVPDIKGENWQLTAGWRARFGRALLFDPTDPDSSAYNPLLEVRRGDTEVRDVQNVADILSIRKARLSAAITGKRPAIRFWSAPSSTSSTPSPTRRWPGSPTSSPTPGGRPSSFGKFTKKGLLFFQGHVFPPSSTCRLRP
jgi:type IV secretion system protein VirD4